MQQRFVQKLVAERGRWSSRSCMRSSTSPHRARPAAAAAPRRKPAAEPRRRSRRHPPRRRRRKCSRATLMRAAWPHAAPPRSTPSCSRCAPRSTRVDRELLGAAEPPRRPGAEVGEMKKQRRLGGVPPRARSAGHRRPEGGQRRARCCSDSVAPIWREIMSACRALETPSRVAYLGPAGTFSEEAALGFFGSSIVKVPCAKLDEVFHATSAGAADFGVVPVENSTEGVVTRSLDLFLTTPLSIIGETSLYVRHNLLRRDNSLRRHRRRLRPSAGAGAMPRLAQPPPAARRAPAGVEQRRRRAAGQPRRQAGGIASTRAASEFGLHIVAPAIQDDAAQPHPLRDRRPSAPPSAAEARRATTAPAWSSRCRTGRAPCTTCWCR